MVQMVGCARQKSHATELEKHTHTHLAVHCVPTADNTEKIDKYEIVANWLEHNIWYVVCTVY